MAFHPYLFFGGTCRDAFTHYQAVFGGELTLIAMKDMPGEDPPADRADHIAHAALKVGTDLLMGSDDPTSDVRGPVQGMQVNCELTDAAEAGRVFGQLAEGGQVTMPIGPTSWSEMFGMCIDRFGTPWMVSADPTAG